LRSGRNKIVAMLTPDITNPFHSHIFRGAERVAQRAGYSVILIHMSDADTENDLDVVTPLTEGQCDGVLIASGRKQDDRFAPLRLAALPYVVTNRAIDGDVDSFIPDDRETGRMGARILIQAGYRRIGAIFGDMRLTNMNARLDGFKEELSRWKGDVQAEIAVDVRSTQDLVRSVDKLIAHKKHERLEALFVPHSVHAPLVYDECLRRGIAVPDELALLGYSGTSGLALSGIVVPAEQMGEDAMRSLISRLEGPTTKNHGRQSPQPYPPTINEGCTLHRRKT
jgi:LacI family transcriptional regulator